MHCPLDRSGHRPTSRLPTRRLPCSRPVFDNRPVRTKRTSRPNYTSPLSALLREGRGITTLQIGFLQQSAKLTR